ncbi:MAG: hypothetical protein PUB00_03780 [Clostridiales bacterium]|nr:hypothetical protein [Clostridiales bacterium]
MNQCRKCGKALTGDEIAIYRKLICRTAQNFLCKECQAAYFGCSIELIDEKIRQFRESGCFLFPKPEAAGQKNGICKK